MDKSKVYCYIDETGQDTKGDFFIVVVIIVGDEKGHLESYLETIEEKSGKRKRKWIKTREKEKINYLSLLLENSPLQEHVFYSKYTNTIEYEQMTILTIKNSLNEYINQHRISEYKATIIIDGLNQTAGERVAIALRRAGIKIRKVRGEKDENNPLIRLSDALAGGIREAQEANATVKKYISALSKEKKLIEIQAERNHHAPSRGWSNLS